MRPGNRIKMSWGPWNDWKKIKVPFYVRFLYVKNLGSNL